MQKGRDMAEQGEIYLGGGGEGYVQPQYLKLKYANRHGLVAGATGTGKTVTLQILAESFSAQGVPVFLADVKGDLSGLAAAALPSDKPHEALQSRAEKIGFADYGYDAFPVVFWDLFGAQGHPVRTTVTEMGPLLLARLLELTEAQEGVLNIAFRMADEEGLALVDLKDLRALLVWLGENSKAISLEYGNISTASIGAIQRRLIVLENQGAEAFFGEPALELGDMIATTPDGRGRINVLASDKLMQSPRLYATFLLWLLSELFEDLPEVGDPDKPKFVFFFDEAHLLFEDAPKALVNKVEQVARLIRSKGVGVYFVTQNPDDVPEDILGQLGNRVQHALRAFTPRDQKALKAAAQTFRANERFDTAEAIREVGVGEALISTLQKKGVPGVVERVLVRPPSSRLGPLSKAERTDVLAQSPLRGLYDEAVDRESAFELLEKRAEAAAAAAEAEAERQEKEEAAENRASGTGRRYSPSGSSTRRTRSRSSDSIQDLLVKSAIRTVSTQSGRRFLRGMLGGLFKG
ncbi:MAG: helicase HerA-like domain-containing protein [Pseudomonadota bacterium]